MKVNKSTKLLIGIFFFLTAIGFFMRSSFFNIEDIQVETASLEIKKLTEKMLENVKGQNMWEIEAEELSSQLTNKSRAIQSVFFQRHWPATLKVKIEERTPVAQTFIEREMWILDAEGVTFKKKLSNLPLYWPLPADRKVFHESLRWLGSELPKGVNGLTWDKELGLVVLFEENIRIVMGRSDFSENWRKAKEALDYLRSRKLQSRRIDATYNNRAVVSL